MNQPEPSVAATRPASGPSRTSTLAATSGLAIVYFSWRLHMLALIPLVLQMLTWRILFGHYIAYSYGGKTFGSKGGRAASARR